MNRQKFLDCLNKRLDDIEFRPNGKDSVPIEKVILFIVDMYRGGNFRGFISFKINDNEIYNPRTEQTHTLNREYRDLD